MEAFSDEKSKFSQLTKLLNGSYTKEMWLSEVESIVNIEGRELLRHLLQGHVDKRGLCDMGGFIVGSDGIVRTHKRISSRKIKTLFGTINIRRMRYSKRDSSSNQFISKRWLTNFTKK